MMKTLTIQCRIPVVALAKFALEAEEQGKAIRSKSTLIVNVVNAYAATLQNKFFDEDTALGVLERIFEGEYIVPTVKSTPPTIQEQIIKHLKDTDHAPTDGD